MKRSKGFPLISRWWITKMRIFFVVIEVMSEFLFTFFGCAWVGLWWMPEFTKSGMNVSLLMASLVLVALVNSTYKNYRNIFCGDSISRKFIFYAPVLFIAVVGYFYGLLFKWLPWSDWCVWNQSAGSEIVIRASWGDQAYWEKWAVFDEKTVLKNWAQIKQPSRDPV